MTNKARRAKWHLWRGHPDRALVRLQEINQSLKESKEQRKVKKLISYIINNRDCIIDYRQRQKNGLIFTSQLAESTVESLINQRCKRQQHMRWSRKGLHALLQVRASIFSNAWQANWEDYIGGAMLKSAA